MALPEPKSYRERWISWVTDSAREGVGLTFDRTPAGPIKAPPGMIRVCAWHIDFDERPTCYLDVPRLEEAKHICAHLFEACGWNIDFATAHDDAGEVVASRPYG